jgi:hypothetical protein
VLYKRLKIRAELRHYQLSYTLHPRKHIYYLQSTKQTAIDNFYESINFRLILQKIRDILTFYVIFYSLTQTKNRPFFSQFSFRKTKSLPNRKIQKSEYKIKLILSYYFITCSSRDESYKKQYSSIQEHSGVWGGPPCACYCLRNTC